MRYYLLIPNVEAEWQAKPEEDRNALFAVHEKFAALLAERGHTILRGTARCSPLRRRR